jgi:hypothetical protein
MGFLGCSSPEGRAIRALRRVFLQIGLERQEIRATAPLEPLLLRFGWRLLSPCVRLAPGALPSLKAVGGLHCLLVLMLVIFFCGSGFAFFSPIGVLSLCLALLTLLLLWIPHPAFRGSLVLPGVETLGELAACLGNKKSGELGAAPNGGPGTRLHSPSATGGPPSVS